MISRSHSDAMERAVTFDCEGERLIGIVAQPDRPAKVGVLIVVGGAQYRVGSHRQFVLLARKLARHGFATLRFDYRGMGDSEGAMRSFDAISADIAAAIAALRDASPGVERVVIWGLCDAASAALIYVHETGAPVDGLVLLNPWVRSETTLARVRLKHYYVGRALDREFWTKLLRGQLDLASTVRGFFRSVADSRGADDGPHATPQPPGFNDKMAAGMASFEGPVLIILSERDLTAQEFVECARADPHWRRQLARASVERLTIERSDHTFASARSRGEVEKATLDWLARKVARAA